MRAGEGGSGGRWCTHTADAPHGTADQHNIIKQLLLLWLYLGKKINSISSGSIPGISLLPPSPANRALATDRHEGWGQRAPLPPGHQTRSTGGPTALTRSSRRRRCCYTRLHTHSRGNIAAGTLRKVAEGHPSLVTDVICIQWQPGWLEPDIQLDGNEETFQREVNWKQTGGWAPTKGWLDEGTRGVAAVCRLLPPLPASPDWNDF